MTLLGGFAVTRGALEVDALKSRPSLAALLSFVAVEGSVTRDQAAALLWPDADHRRGRHALSQALYQLRKILGRGWIVTRGQEIRLGEGVEVDTSQADEAFRRGSMEDALQWLGGRFLEGWHLRATVPFQEWVAGRERHYRDLHRDACRRRLASLLERGDVGEAIDTARSWVRTEPDFEDATTALVRSLHAAGRFQGALEAYQAYADRLVEIGGTVGPELTGLLAGVRAGLRGSEGVAPATPTGGPAHRVLVLPFIHAGPEDRAHRTDGLTDDVTHRLSRRADLAVIAPTSALQVLREGRTLVEIGRALRVDSIVEGRVRWGGRGVRASAQHVRVSDGTRLWAMEIEAGPGEMVTLSKRLARRAVGALGLPPEPSDEGPADGGRETSPAWELCLRGLQHWHRRSRGGLREAVDLFLRAIEADPSFPRSYGCLALAYAMMPSFTGASPGDWMPRAFRVVGRALDLDPDLVEGHLARGILAWTFDVDADTAGRHLGYVLSREPSNAQARVWDGYRLAALGSRQDARTCAAEALDLDPLSVSTNFDVGMVRWQLGEEEPALEQMRRVLGMDPAFTPAAFVLGAWHLRRNEVEHARRAWSRITGLGPLWASLVDVLEHRARAVAAVDRIVELAPYPVHWYLTAVVYTLLGERDRALDWLERHFRNLRGDPGGLPTGGPGFALVATDPFFDPLRSTGRLQALVGALGLDPARPPDA